MATLIKDIVNKGGGRTRRLLAVSATAVLASLAVAVPVLAATPPNLPREITIFPERDFVAIDGYRANTNLNVSVIRGGTVVGTARGRTDATGFLEVNHPGGVCWDFPTTPDIQPGDTVRVRNTNLTPNIDDSNIAINAKVVRQDVDNTPDNPDDDVAAAIVDTNNTPDNPDDDNLVVKGTAQNPDGTPIPLDRLEQRIIQPDLVDTRVGRRDIRADSAGGRLGDIADGEGNLSYDPIGPDNPEGIEWTATYTGLNGEEIQLAAEGQARILSWLRTTAAGDRLGITIFEDGEVGGRGFGGCPPGPNDVVDPATPDAPLLYDDDPASPTFQTYDASQLLDPEVATTDLAQLHEVVVFPERDFVSVGGFTAGQNLEFVVRRPGVGVVGSSVGVVGRDGVFEVNHPGGEVWTGQTPDIKPSDIVDIVQFDDPDGSVAATFARLGGKNGDEVVTGGETQRTINVTAVAPVRNANGTPANLNDDRLTIRGNAQNPDGSRIPLDRLEQRIIQPDFRDGNGPSRITRRDIRADSEGGRVDGPPNGAGNLTYPNATGNTWTATYTGLNNAEIVLAMAGQTRILSWLAADANGERFGITIHEVGEVGGPGMGGAPPTGDEALPIVE